MMARLRKMRFMVEVLLTFKHASTRRMMGVDETGLTLRNVSIQERSISIRISQFGHESSASPNALVEVGQTEFLVRAMQIIVVLTPAQ